MNSGPDSSERLVQLPIQVRPQPGETTDSYIRRLARANHLKPSYLHGFLTGAPNWIGRPQLERLATLTGRTTHVLETALSDVAHSPIPNKPGSTRRNTTQERQQTAARAARKKQVFATIRRDHATEEISIRKLAARHGVHRRTILQALKNPTPPARKPLPRRPSAIDPVQHLIDPMIKDGGRPIEIWARLIDEHDTSISYATISSYVRSQTAS